MEDESAHADLAWIRRELDRLNHVRLTRRFGEAEEAAYCELCAREAALLAALRPTG